MRSFHSHGKIFFYARCAARSIARAPAVDMEMQLEMQMEMQMEQKMYMDLERGNGGDGAFADAHNGGWPLKA